MRICVIGAGATGCLHGAHLARAGHEVTLVDVRPEVVEAINRNGVQVDGAGGEFRVRAAATTADSAEGPVDAVFVHVDANSTVDAAQVAGRIADADGYALTLQNGIGNVEALGEVLGPNRVLGGTSYNSVSSPGPGRVTHTNPGPTTIGELDGSVTQRARSLGDVLEQAGFPTQVTDNVMGSIWSKFVHNCAFSPICAVAGMLGGEIAGNPAADTLQDRIVEELMAVVKAKGIALDEQDPVATIKEVARTVFVKPSMLQHMEQGRRTEIEAFNGAAVREGRALGIPMPYNDALALMVKARNVHEMSRREPRRE